ncbi:MAG: primosomal protein N' [Alphaproteobacteria bacterium]|nr:primosomal protein N' [Alphaproteobacteria bacterium]
MPPSHTTPRPTYRDERVSVLLPLPLAGAYDYLVPPDLSVSLGDFVSVPLGKRDLKGVVWGNGSNEVDDKKLKNINGLLDIPPMSEDLRKLVDWTASYTLNPPGAVLRMSMSVPSALEPPKTRIGYLPGVSAVEDEGDSRIRMTEARRRVLAVLAEGPPRVAAELARSAGVSASVVRSMADAGLLKPVTLQQQLDMDLPDWERPRPILSPSQAEAAAALVAAVEKSVAAADDNGFSVVLLDGVTGSGKTEVYFEAIAATLAAGRQVLVLLPEIALTTQWLKRFTERFGARPLEWHSDLTGAERRLTWRAIVSGEASVVVGARSALFLPFPNLGLTVVDEEHDSSFKQDEGVCYNARDMAVVRARLGNFPIILSSATPSLETFVNVQSGRYKSLSLPERHGGASLPEIAAIDMRIEPMESQSWLAPALQEAVAHSLAAGEQVMLFLNRRGYAPLTLCRHCGHRFQCPNCTSWLVEHRLQRNLSCHHCGFSTPPPEECPACGTPETLAACGPGVERLAEEVAERFPQAHCEIMASDTMQSPTAAEALVRHMQNREIDILIGTQIMAKGHHFPYLTLVGVVDADLGLAGGDLRAAERTFQLLHQVSGRAGRAERPGRVLLQTYRPEDPVMEALVTGTRDEFLTAEAEERERHGMPPFGRLAALIISGNDYDEVERIARSLGRSCPVEEGVTVLGPAPAPLSILRGRHRWRLLLKARRDSNVRAILRSWLAGVRIRGNVRVQIDVDPYNFL